MSSPLRIDQLRSRAASLEMTDEQFRSLGHDVVDRIAAFLGSLPGRAVTPAEPADKVRAALGAARTLPEEGKEADELLMNTADLLFEHSLFNGHPGFYGYITSSAAPIGMLAELLAAAVNANVFGREEHPCEESRHCHRVVRPRACWPVSGGVR
jgi:hypothetical protein